MTPVERLIERLRKGFGDRIEIEDDLAFDRTYAGARQREAGAWSWFIHNHGSMRFASYDPVTKLLRAERLVLVNDRLDIRGYEVYDSADVGTPAYDDLVEAL